MTRQTRRALPVAAAAAVLAWSLWTSSAVAHESLTTTVLFNREIVRVLNKHCVMCHAAGSLSFPLETYEQTFLQGRAIRSRALDRHMPPWSAVSGYGSFANDNGLTLREVQFIVSWVEGSGPRTGGTVFLNVATAKGSATSQVRAQPDFDRWQLGEPSSTRQLPDVTIDSGQKPATRRSVVDLGLQKESWLRGFEYRPGDRRVVTSAVFTVQETGQWLGNWTPWYGFASLPSDVAFRLPAGAHIVADVQYRGTTEQVVDKGTLGLYLSDGPAKASPADLVLNAQPRSQPVGKDAIRLSDEAKLTAATTVLALRPEIGPGITSVEVRARRPDGGSEILLYVKNLSMEWPTSYVFRKPVDLPAGTVLALIAYADGGVEPAAKGLRLTVSHY